MSTCERWESSRHRSGSGPENEAPTGIRWGLRITTAEPLVRIELTTARLRIECSTTELQWRGYCMPWRGFEPRRLAALPPQDSVSTSFTTRAWRARTYPPRPGRSTPPPAGLEGHLDTNVEDTINQRHFVAPGIAPLVQRNHRSDTDRTRHLGIVSCTDHPGES